MLLEDGKLDGKLRPTQIHDSPSAAQQERKTAVQGAKWNFDPQSSPTTACQPNLFGPSNEKEHCSWLLVLQRFCRSLPAERVTGYFHSIVWQQLLQ